MTNILNKLRSYINLLITDLALEQSYVYQNLYLVFKQNMNSSTKITAESLNVLISQEIILTRGEIRKIEKFFTDTDNEIYITNDEQFIKAYLSLIVFKDLDLINDKLIKAIVDEINPNEIKLREIICYNDLCQFSYIPEIHKYLYIKCLDNFKNKNNVKKFKLWYKYDDREKICRIICCIKEMKGYYSESSIIKQLNTRFLSVPQLMHLVD